MTSPQSSQFDALLVQCRDLACSRLSASLSVMLDQSDSALGALAVKAKSQEDRKVFLVAKEITTSNRSLVETQFKLRFLSEFQQRAN